MSLWRHSHRRRNTYSRLCRRRPIMSLWHHNHRCHNTYSRIRSLKLYSNFLLRYSYCHSQCQCRNNLCRRWNRSPCNKFSHSLYSKRSHSLCSRRSQNRSLCRLYLLFRRRKFSRHLPCS